MKISVPPYPKNHCVVLALLWRKQALSGAILGISLGLIASDLLQHFVVLPLTVGNTGWHWP